MQIGTAPAHTSVPLDLVNPQTVARFVPLWIIGPSFAASTSFLSPIGYQTNLMAYGPGGYDRFRARGRASPSDPDGRHHAGDRRI